MPRANMWISAVLVLIENLADLYILYGGKLFSYLQDEKKLQSIQVLYMIIRLHYFSFSQEPILQHLIGILLWGNNVQVSIADY